MTSDGSEGLCNDVLLLEEFPVGCAGVGVAQGRICSFLCSIALRHSFATFILYLC